MNTKFLNADAAAALIPDGATVALMGGGGGLMEATCVFQAIERRFLATQQPRGLEDLRAWLGDLEVLNSIYEKYLTLLFQNILF